jgi:invasion protein IalB
MTHKGFPHRRPAFVLMAATMLVAASAAVAQQPPQTPPAQRSQTQPAPAPAPRPQTQPPAKQPQRPAQPTPAPAQPQPQQPAQAPAQQPPPLIYSQWVKFCLNEQGGKSVCFTGKDARIETGMMIASAALIEPQGEPKKLLRINVPLAMKLEHGTRIIIDQTAPRTAPYVACFVTGCVADYEVNVDTINQMKKSQQLSIQAIGINGQPFTVPLPLAEFAKAYDGPPTDPKVIEEQQKKLEEEFTKKREEMMRQQQNAPGQQPGRTQ